MTSPPDRGTGSAAPAETRAPEEHPQGQIGAEEPHKTAEGAEDRDLFADAREVAAGRRERLADERDELADERERTADARHRALDTWERTVDERESALNNDAAEPDTEPNTNTDAASADARRSTAMQSRRESGIQRAADAELRDMSASARQAANDDRLLIRALTELGRDLYRSDPTPAIPQRVVEIAAAGIIDTCEAASLTVASAGSTGTLTTIASAGPLAEAVDSAQRLAGAGPAFDAIGAPVVQIAGSGWEQWPGVRSAAAEAGVRSAASFGLLLGGSDPERLLGSLNLYSTRLEGFTDEEIEIGMLLATYVAVALALAEDRDFTAQRVAALQQALTTRDVIGQAKGILMERQHLSAEEAFDVLRRASQRMNVKLNEVAERMAQAAGAGATQAAPTPPLN